MFSIHNFRASLCLLLIAFLVACDAQVNAQGASEAKADELERQGSKWDLREDKDPITDEVSRFAALASNEASQLYLLIGCQSNFGVDTLGLKSGEYSQFEVGEVIYRIDQSDPVKETWFIHDTTYSRPHDGKDYIDRLHKKLEGAKKLAIRTKPLDPDEESVTLTFDIRGIDKARSYVLDVGSCSEKES